MKFFLKMMEFGWMRWFSGLQGGGGHLGWVGAAQRPGYAWRSGLGLPEGWRPFLAPSGGVVRSVEPKGGCSVVGAATKGPPSAAGVWTKVQEQPEGAGCCRSFRTLRPNTSNRSQSVSTPPVLQRRWRTPAKTAAQTSWDTFCGWEISFHGDRLVHL